jgi:Gas vesicle synthesis protein GvpL/GvpF
MGGSRRVPLPTAVATATYVYCVVRDAARPVMATALESMPGGGAPRVLPIARHAWLVVADVPVKAFGQDALNQRLQDVEWMSRCGVAHQAVIESFLDSDAVVPMTLFTIFANDERALAEAKKDKARLDASLDRVAGRTEWVVRVLRGDAATSATSATSAAADGRGGAGTGGAVPAAVSVATRTRDSGVAAPRSGREFLQAKVNQRQAVRRAAEETSHAVRALLTALSDVADEVSDRTEALTSGALGTAALLDAAFLVARAAEPRFEQAARRMAQPLADRGFRVSVTGPWPCYSFVASRP